MQLKVDKNSVLIYYVGSVRFMTTLTINFHIYKCWDCLNYETG